MSEPKHNFTVEVPTATFPTAQRMSQHVHLIIAVRNVSNKTIPDLAVTICNETCAYPAPPGEGTSAQAFGAYLNSPNITNPPTNLASQSRPVWIVDRPPGLCGYSCVSGAPGAAATAYSNTWALGAVRPNQTVTFNWLVTAVKPGKHVVAWQVAGGLNGKSKTYLADGSPPRGTFTVNISQAPQQSYVTDSGQIKVTKGP